MRLTNRGAEEQIVDLLATGEYKSRASLTRQAIADLWEKEILGIDPGRTPKTYLAFSDILLQEGEGERVDPQPGDHVWIVGSAEGARKRLFQAGLRMIEDPHLMKEDQEGRKAYIIVKRKE